MHIRRGIAALAASAALAGGIVATAMPAGAAPGDTATTFAITAAGGLSITVPASANLGSAASGAASLAGTLGNVQVTDQRGGLLPLWTATVSATDFTTGGGTANEKVAKADISYASGSASQTGLGLPVVQTGVALSAPARALNFVGVAGNNSAQWNPTLTLTLLASQVTGTYSGTITHSVA